MGQSPVQQDNTADSGAALWLKCAELPRVGVGAQILWATGLRLRCWMTRAAADGDADEKRGKARNRQRP
jgi:hypothetical protein